MLDKSGDLIMRHPVRERLNHWTTAIAFLFLFVSGLAMFHPFFFWASFLFGGGQLMRALHPLAGVVMAVSFYSYAAQVWRDNRWLPADTQWMTRMWYFMRMEYHPTDTGKYNAGQKLMFWSMVPLIAVLLCTGVLLWQPYFAPYAAPGLRRLAGLVHATCAFIMFIGIGVHWYAAYWTKGSVRSMVRGTVSQAWARYHHPAWYRDLMGGRV